MTDSVANEADQRITRVIDFRIPLWGVLSSMAVIGWGLISMWFILAQLVRTVDDLQLTVKSGNTSVSVLSSEVALLKFRIGSNEDEIKRLNEVVRNTRR